MTTIEVLVLEEAAPVPLCLGFQPSNVSSDSDDENIENIDTRTNPRVLTIPTIQGEPSHAQEDLSSTIQGGPTPIAQENANIDPTAQDDST